MRSLLPRGPFGRVLMIAGDNRRDHLGFPLPETERELRAAAIRRRRRAEALGRRPLPQGEDSGLYALSWLGMTMEEVVRDWLYEQGFDLDPRHEIYFTEHDADGRELPALSREVDAVVVDRYGLPRMLVETRLSVRGISAVNAKMLQLQTTLDILATQRKWRRLKPLVVYIAVGDHQKEVITKPVWLVDSNFQISRRWLEAYRRDTTATVGIPRIVIPLNWLWQYAKRLRWELNEELFIEAEIFARARSRRRDAARRLWEIQAETEHDFPAGE